MMRVLCISGPREGDSGALTYNEADGSPRIEIRWDSGGTTMEFRTNLLNEDSAEAARWIRDRLKAARHHHHPLTSG
jgi:hypothetical protein